MTHIVRISNDDDWEGVYIDGVIADQNHSVDYRYILEKLNGMGLIRYEEFLVDQDWMYSQGHLPENLDEIPEDAKCD